MRGEKREKRERRRREKLHILSSFFQRSNRRFPSEQEVKVLPRGKSFK